jgi:hypothetical protein
MAGIELFTLPVVLGEGAKVKKSKNPSPIWQSGSDTCLHRLYP